MIRVLERKPQSYSLNNSFLIITSSLNLEMLGQGHLSASVSAVDTMPRTESSAASRAWHNSAVRRRIMQCGGKHLQIKLIQSPADETTVEAIGMLYASTTLARINHALVTTEDPVRT